jgi:hypothetical protein
LLRFRYLFGGGIDREKKSGCYRWRVTGSRAIGFLMTIYAFLSPWRQAQVRAALRVSKPLVRRRTTCKRGHALTPDNVISRPGGQRQCKECVALMRRARGARRAERSKVRSSGR